MFKRLICAAALAIAALPANAAIQFYGGTTGLTETDFTNQMATLGLTPSALVNFTGELAGLSILDVGPTGVDFSAPTTISVSGSQGQYVALNSGDSLLIDFPTGVYAYGMHLSKVTSGSAATWTFGPYGGASAGSVTIPTSGTVFLGVISTTPLTTLPSIVLTAPAANKAFNIDDFKIGTLEASETPEPSTFALLGGALIALPVLARRRRVAGRLRRA